MAYNEINEEFMAIWQMKWECNSWWLVDMEVEEENRKRHTKKDMQDFYLSISMETSCCKCVCRCCAGMCSKSCMCCYSPQGICVFKCIPAIVFPYQKKKETKISSDMQQKKVKTLLFQWKIEYSRQWQSHAAFLGPLKLSSYIYHSTNDF